MTTPHDTPKAKPPAVTYFIPSAYHHPAKDRNRSEFIAGYGVWDVIQEDWLISDGYETEEAARAAAERMNAAINAEIRAVWGNWKSHPHGLAHGSYACAYCDEG